MRQRDSKKLVLALCEQTGAKVEFAYTGGAHVKATVHYRNQSRFLILPGSSCYFWLPQEIKANLRHILRELGVPQPGNKQPKERETRHQQVREQTVVVNADRAPTPVQRSFRGQLKDWRWRHVQQ